MAQFYKRRGPDGDHVFDEISLSSQTILDTARQQGIKVTKIPYTGLFELSYGSQTHYLHAQPPSDNTRTSVYCCNNKAVTKSMLKRSGLSVPAGFVLKSSDSPSYQDSIYAKLNKPLVVKPIDASLAANVFANLTNPTDYHRAINSIQRYYGQQPHDILVEEMFVGTEYRIIATRKKVVGIMARIPANVVGDGTHTIQQLVKQKNTHPWRGGVYPLHTIRLEVEEIKFLQTQGYKLTDIPARATQIFLRPRSPLNIDKGGDTVDMTHLAHPSVAKLAIKAIRAIPGLTWGGIDYFSHDITQPQNAKNYTILEINTSPNIAWQEFPAVGHRRQVALEYLKVIFPQLTRKIKQTRRTRQATLSHANLRDSLINFPQPAIIPSI